MTVIPVRRAFTLLLALAACSSDAAPHASDGGNEIPDAAVVEDTLAGDGRVDDTSAPDAPAADAAGPDAAPALDSLAPAWAEVDRLAREVFTKESLAGLGVVVRDRMDRTVFSATYGDFDLGRTIAVASASKLVSGLVLLDLVGRGVLTLDATAGAILGWPAPKASITLRHLMSFTSGLKPEAACTFNAAMTLEACVDIIRDAALEAPLATQFDYGGTHLHVAGRMAEVATGKSWNELFRDILAGPLGLPADVAYFTSPRQGVGQRNPLVAGGLRVSTLGYLELLALYFHKGRYRGLTVGVPAGFDEAAREPFPSVTIGTSPAATVGRNFRYGLASWLECDTPATGCATISSPGAFGFTPWVDRDAGYYAVVAMELGNAMGGVVKLSIDLEQALQPAIETALAR